MVMRTLQILVVATLWSASVSAMANDDQGRVEFEEGTRLYKNGEYAAALPWFIKAYQLSDRRPSTIRALAQCERNLEMNREAIAHYQEYLATDPPEEDAAAVRATIESLEARSERARQLPRVTPRYSGPTMIAATEVDEHRTLMPLVTVGASGVLLAFGAAMFVVGRNNAEFVDDPPPGAQSRAIEEADHRASRMTSMGAVLIGFGLAGATAGVSWLASATDD